MDISDDLIEQFISLTNSDSQTAKQYLEAFEGDMSNAVTNYFNNDDTSSTFNRPSTSSANVDTDFDQLEADARLANQLAAETDTVRSPIRPVTERLIDPFPNMLSGNPFAPYSSRSIRSFSNAFSDDEVEDQENVIDIETSPTRAKERKLEDLFKPPLDLMFTGSIEQARIKGKQDKKFLLLNIQDPTEFPCQVLNRDVWKSPTVKAIVRENFIFLQYLIQHHEGQWYKTFYPFEGFPHIAVLDPRTSERLISWDRTFTPAEFIETVTDFLSRNDPSGSVQAPPPKLPPPPKTFDQMSESEQIEAAIAASLKEHANNQPSPLKDESQSSSSVANDNKSNDDHNSVELIEIPDGSDDLDNTAQIAIDTPPLDPVDQLKQTVRNISPKLPPTPEAGALTTRIKFNFPDGSSKVQAFSRSDKIINLFEFVKTQIPQEAEDLELVCMRKPLAPNLNDTLSDANLLNALIMVSFILE